MRSSEGDRQKERERQRRTERERGLLTRSARDEVNLETRIGTFSSSRSFIEPMEVRCGTLVT
jgi:hypothetical protein